MPSSRKSLHLLTLLFILLTTVLFSTQIASATATPIPSESQSSNSSGISYVWDPLMKKQAYALVLVPDPDDDPNNPDVGHQPVNCGDGYLIPIGNETSA